VVDDRVDDSPALTDFVRPDEERGVAEEGVEDQALVGLRRFLAEGCVVGEVHGRRPDAERVAWDFGAEAE
jgi:hypothetical protein